jgi:trimethylamine---corrinoid protein Co-methyltransferase
MLLRLNNISDAEFRIMHNEILDFLWDYGVLFEDDEGVDLLIKAGNSKGNDGRIHLKKGFVSSMIKLLPEKGFRMYGRDLTKELLVAPGSIAFRPSTGTPFVMDHETKQRRNATTDDARDLVTIVDKLDNYDMVHSVVSPVNTPGGAENILMFVNSHRYSCKPSDITVMTPQEVRTIGRIALAIRGGDRTALKTKPLTAVDVAMISPLRCAGEQVQALLECARTGLPIEVLTAPAMGTTAPVTVAGSAMVAMADFFAAVCLVYLIAPGLGMINTARISPTNMHTTSPNYGTPEMGMGSVLVAQLCERYNAPSNLYGFCTVAKNSGAQAELEKLTSALPLAMCGGAHMITGGGVLDDALTTSAEQLVIDDESIRYIKRLLRPIVIDKAAIGADIIRSGMEDYGCLLGEEHTIKYLRDGELMDCGLDQWTSYQEWEDKGRPDLYELAHKRVEEIRSAHAVSDFSPAVGREIDRILDETL